MEIYGDIWRYMEICGDMWRYVEIGILPWIFFDD